MMLWASASTAVSSPTGGEGMAAVAPGLVFGPIVGPLLSPTGVGGDFVPVTGMRVHRAITTSLLVVAPVGGSGVTSHLGVDGFERPVRRERAGRGCMFDHVRIGPSDAWVKHARRDLETFAPKLSIKQRFIWRIPHQTGFSTMIP